VISDETRELIKYRIERSLETLDDAKILFENKKLFSSVNRIYYSMFFAITALLLTKAMSSAKHSGTLSIFNKEFVNTGLVDKKLGRFYNEMFEFRQKADYKDFVSFKDSDIEAWLAKAQEFLSVVNSIINK
jgi:uncharacterized protein